MENRTKQLIRHFVRDWHADDLVTPDAPAIAHRRLEFGPITRDSADFRLVIGFDSRHSWEPIWAAINIHLDRDGMTSSTTGDVIYLDDGQIDRLIIVARETLWPVTVGQEATP